jgi:hypothetical protein
MPEIVERTNAMRLLRATAVPSFFLFAIASLSCSTSAYREVYPTLLDGKYDTEFPYRGCSKQLEEISESVKMLSTVAYYRTYAFPESDHLRLRDITRELLAARAAASVFVNKSMSGTATVLSYQNRSVVLMTCAHVVSFADTLVSYHTGADRRPTSTVRSIAVKERQMNFVGLLPEGGELEILALDGAADIALLGKRFMTEPPFPIPVFRYPFGKAKELDWGSFVYLFGYPSGFRIVTKGIVSSPNRDKRGTFLVDAVFGGGFSGGIALAVRDGVPNFELVGMIKMVSAHSSFVLTPPVENGVVDYDTSTPYTGDIYVDKHTDIDYGVTQATSVERILEFLEEHRSEVQAKGYSLNVALTPR